MSWGVLFGLGAALSWGLADFWGRGLSHRVGALRAVLRVEISGLIALSAAIALDWGGTLARWDWPSVGVMALTGLAGVVALLSLYRGFEVGILSVVSPITASAPAVSVTLAVLFLGERLGALQVAGIVLTILGIALMSTDFRQLRAVKLHHLWRAAGLGWALLAFLSFGLAFFGIGVAAPRLGAIQAMWVLRLVSLAALLFVFVARGSRDRPAQTAPWWRGAHVGLFDSGGGLFIAWGVQVGTVAVVSTVSSLFTAVTVLLAWVFVKERLAWNQLAGFLLILLGVALISAH